MNNEPMGLVARMQVGRKWTCAAGLWLIASCVVDNLSAQATCTATVTQPLVVSVLGYGTQSRAVGALPLSGVSLLQSGVGSSALGAYPYVAPYMRSGGAGWRVAGVLDVDSTIQFWHSGNWSLSGQIRLHMQSPTPVQGILYISPEFRHYGPFPTFAGDVTLDIDASGTPDYSCRQRAPFDAIESVVTLDAVGRDFIIDLNMSASWTFVGPGDMNATAYATWDVVFLPDTYALDTDQVGCVPMGFGRSDYPFPHAAWDVGLGASPPQGVPGIVAGIFLLGTSPQNVPLTTPPYCPLLVADPAVVLPTNWGATGVSLWPPEMQMPPGLTFYLQAAWLNTANQIITSDSVRTL